MISSMNRDKQERLAIGRRQGSGLGVDDLDRARPMAQAADMAALLQSIDQPKDAGPGLKTKPIAYLGERWGDAARCLLIGVDISEGFKQIGRASCRERGGRYVYISVVAAALK